MNYLYLSLLCVGISALTMRTRAEDGYCNIYGQRVWFGEDVYSEEPCNKFHCNGDGSISAAGCPVFIPMPGCKKVRDDGKYPACCEKQVCS